MATLSLCMIVKNEEEKLPNLLNSVKDIFDEIIIVDTGSTDNTVKVAESFKAKVYNFKWIYDFSAARNYSFSKATMDYIMWLDADDIIKSEDIIKIKNLKSNIDKDTDIIMAKYNCGEDENKNPILSYYRARILKRSNNYLWNDRIHEYIQPKGKIVNSDIIITHTSKNKKLSNRNLDIFERMINEGETLTPRNLFYYARELYYHGRLIESINKFNEFLDTENGWVEDKISACYDLAICYNQIGEKRKAINSLFRSFEYSPPRAEHCSCIGNYYFEIESYKSAIFWYELASKLEKPSDSWGFMLNDYWYYFPNIQLCLCHYKIGNLEKAREYNRIAGLYKPNDKSVKHNEEFFKKQLK